MKLALYLIHRFMFLCYSLEKYHVSAHWEEGDDCNGENQIWQPSEFDLPQDVLKVDQPVLTQPQSLI